MRRHETYTYRFFWAMCHCVALGLGLDYYYSLDGLLTFLHTVDYFVVFNATTILSNY